MVSEQWVEAVEELPHVWVLRAGEPTIKIANNIHWNLIGDDGFQLGCQLIVKHCVDYNGSRTVDDDDNADELTRNDFSGDDLDGRQNTIDGGFW
jgi:hypothetical protein